MTDNPLPGGEAPTPQELRALLREKGITIKEFSSILGYSYNHTSGILSGRSKMPQGFPARFHEALTRAMNSKRGAIEDDNLPQVLELATSYVRIPVILTSSETICVLAHFTGKEYRPKTEDLPALLRIIVQEWIDGKDNEGKEPFNYPGHPGTK